MRKYTIGAGRDLTNFEKGVLTAIDNHPYPALVGYGSLGAINVNLLLEDDYSFTEPVTIDCDAVSRELNDVQNLFNSLRNGNNGKLLDEVGLKIRSLRMILQQAGQDHGIVTKNVEIHWTGSYENKGKNVYLYMEEIDANKPIQYNPYCHRENRTLYITYVHEMMHAYFETQNAEKRVEEPIVEYCTLKFIEDFCKKNSGYDDMFNTAQGEVNSKKTCFGMSYYGFGYYLFTKSNVDLMGIYKERNNKYSHKSTSFNRYVDKFGGSEIYPVTTEKDTETLLHDLLFDKDIKSKVPSASVTSAVVPSSSVAHGTYAILMGGLVIAKSSAWADLVKLTVTYLLSIDINYAAKMNSIFSAHHPRSGRSFIITLSEYKAFLNSTRDTKAESRYMPVPGIFNYLVNSQWGVDNIMDFFQMLKELNIGFEIWKLEAEI